MKKKLTKHGNSLAIILDKPILDLLNIDEHTELKITTDGVKIELIPVDFKRNKVSSNKKIQKSFDEAIKEYAPALKKLADN